MNVKEIGELIRESFKRPFEQRLLRLDVIEENGYISIEVRSGSRGVSFRQPIAWFDDVPRWVLIGKLDTLFNMVKEEEEPRCEICGLPPSSPTARRFACFYHHPAQEGQS